MTWRRSIVGLIAMLLLVPIPGRAGPVEDAIEDVGAAAAFTLLAGLEVTYEDVQVCAVGTVDPRPNLTTTVVVMIAGHDSTGTSNHPIFDTKQDTTTTNTAEACTSRSDRFEGGSGTVHWTAYLVSTDVLAEAVAVVVCRGQAVWALGGPSATGNGCG